MSLDGRKHAETTVPAGLVSFSVQIFDIAEARGDVDAAGECEKGTV